MTACAQVIFFSDSNGIVRFGIGSPERLRDEEAGERADGGAKEDRVGGLVEEVLAAGDHLGRIPILAGVHDALQLTKRKPKPAAPPLQPDLFGAAKALRRVPRTC
jgi:hypothetical protein